MAMVTNVSQETNVTTPPDPLSASPQVDDEESNLLHNARAEDGIAKATALEISMTPQLSESAPSLFSMVVNKTNSRDKGRYGDQHANLKVQPSKQLNQSSQKENERFQESSEQFSKQYEKHSDQYQHQRLSHRTHTSNPQEKKAQMRKLVPKSLSQARNSKQKIPGKTKKALEAVTTKKNAMAQLAFSSSSSSSPSSSSPSSSPSPTTSSSARAIVCSLSLPAAQLPEPAITTTHEMPGSTTAAAAAQPSSCPQTALRWHILRDPTIHAVLHGVCPSENSSATTALSVLQASSDNLSSIGGRQWHHLSSENNDLHLLRLYEQKRLDVHAPLLTSLANETARKIIRPAKKRRKGFSDDAEEIIKFMRSAADASAAAMVAAEKAKAIQQRKESGSLVPLGMRRPLLGNTTSLPPPLSAARCG